MLAISDSARSVCLLSAIGFIPPGRAILYAYGTSTRINIGLEGLLRPVFNVDYFSSAILCSSQSLRTEARKRQSLPICTGCDVSVASHNGNCFTTPSWHEGASGQMWGAGLLPNSRNRKYVATGGSSPVLTASES